MPDPISEYCQARNRDVQMADGVWSSRTPARGTMEAG